MKFPVTPALNLSVKERAYVRPTVMKPASKVLPVPSGWNAVVSFIGSMRSERTLTPTAPGMRFMWKTYPACVNWMSAGNTAWLKESTDFSGSMRATPPAFQKIELASSATPTNAPPMPSARAPTGSLRNCPPNVPTFSKMLAAPAIPGSNSPARPSVQTAFLTISLLRSPGLTDDDELATLSSFLRIDREEVHAAHDVLPVPRDQVPRRLTVVRVVLLPRDRFERLVSDGCRPAHRRVHRVGRLDRLH